MFILFDVKYLLETRLDKDFTELINIISAPDFGSNDVSRLKPVLARTDETVFLVTEGQPIVYNLYAVSNHNGTMFSGHYTAYAKNPYCNQWYSFNDSR